MNRPLLCVFLLIPAMACRAVDRRTFQPVLNASRAIQTAMDGKATLPQFTERLKAYSDAVRAAQAGDRTPREREALREYETALKELTDVQLVWEVKEARGSEMLPVRDELAARIAREYQLGLNTNEPPSIYASEAMHTIWEAARGHLRAASNALGVEP